MGYYFSQGPDVTPPFDSEWGYFLFDLIWFIPMMEGLIFFWWSGLL